MGKIVGLTFNEPLNLVCPYCGKTYKTKEALDKHINGKHPEAASDFCDPSDSNALGQE